MKNRKFIFMLMLYINGLFISQIGFAEPVARDKSFFNINRAKIDFYNQNEKNQHGFIYIKGSFLNAPCELISNEISLK
ncbi:fimbrial protein, partial [Proteus mirabilis]